MIRVDPLIRWSKDDMCALVREQGLPFHPRAIRIKSVKPLEKQPLPPSYHY